jgi:copper transporter 1
MSPTMYALALAFVFALAVLVKWLSQYCNIVKPGTNDVAVGLVQTALYAVRSGADYMLILAVMSFNGGVFLATVVGRLVGFLVFGPESLLGSPVCLARVPRDSPIFFL